MSKASSRSSAAASSTLGLDGLGDLSALLETPVASGRPLELKLEEIAEDPNQPRVEFDEESLAELAESIRQRGVKTPISVRPVKKGGGYMINHGARRFRASRLAGSETIPVYVDDDYTDEDQIIENIHRDALRPREIADYIGRKLAQGKQQKDIAKGLGKSKGWVSQHAVLLDLPRTDCRGVSRRARDRRDGHLRVGQLSQGRSRRDRVVDGCPRNLARHRQKTQGVPRHPGKDPQCAAQVWQG